MNSSACQSIVLILVLLFMPAGRSWSAGSKGISRASRAMAVLDKWYDEETGLWKTTSWWNAANAMTVLIRYSQTSGDTTYDRRIRHTFNHSQPNNFLNLYYDDEGWWALAWIEAYDYLHERAYLEKARSIFADMAGGWDERCGGGLYWKKGRAYKNAISNGLFILTAARLHLRGIGPVEGKSCRQWALDAARWLLDSGMINAHNLVNDGLNSDCRNNGKTTWTYNQGVVLAGLAEVYKISTDSTYLETAHAIAGAAISRLSDEQGILHEPNEPHCNQDQIQFKGIFIRHLAFLNRLSSRPAYTEFIGTNAAAVWQKARNAETDQLGLIWSGPFDRADAARQTSALEALIEAAAIGECQSR